MFLIQFLYKIYIGKQKKVNIFFFIAIAGILLILRHLFYLSIRAGIFRVNIE